MKSGTFKIAFSGICVAFCQVILLCTGLFPFATYALPAVAGLLFVPIMVEFGGKTAYTAFIASAVVAALICPDREAAAMFIIVLGHYPITKAFLERIKVKAVSLIFKFLLFNILAVGSYLLLIYVLGFSEILSEFAEFGEYFSLILLLLGNITFFIYDIGITRMVSLYVFVIKPKYTDKIRKGR